MEITNVKFTPRELCFRVLFEDFLCGEEVIRYKIITFVVDQLPLSASFHVEGEVFGCQLFRCEEGFRLVVDREGEVVNQYDIPKMEEQN